MTTTAPKIFQWRNQVRDDRRLRSIDFMVAYQLSERTNAGEFGKSGHLLTWQGMASMADAIGVSDRTVRRAVKRLQTYKHLAIQPGGGRHRSNRYTLRLQAIAAVKVEGETLTAVSPFLKNPDSRDRVSRETLTTVTRNTDNGDQKHCQACPPNPYIESFPNSSPDRETEDRGASPRLEGARPAPLGKWEPELRQRMGGRFELLSLARLLPSDDAGTIRLAVLTPSQRDQIKQKCEADILAVAGAGQIEYVVEITGGVFAGAAR